MYSENLVTLKGGLIIFYFSIASDEATTYPTLKPAKPYAFENVRNKNALLNASCNFNVSNHELNAMSH